MSNKKRTALVTGAAGFIGFYISKRLLNQGWRVIGIDCLSDYYDVSLKISRESILRRFPSYRSVHEKLETRNVLLDLFEDERPDIVIHLAAQAGVRHSIENPRTYLESNINGSFELLEAARRYPPKHMLLASTSSIYGANGDLPYSENSKTDHQLSFYAATKKATENLAHSYSHLFNLPITVFRFFTVYGPWGRPDMAIYKFTKAIMDNEPIDVYNHGDMSRDFTFIDDLVESIYLLLEVVPYRSLGTGEPASRDSLSPVASYRTVNIGNSEPTSLMDFIKAIEQALNKKAEINFLPIQEGEVKKTWANTSLLQNLIGYRPRTNMKEGVQQFVNWYRNYYSV